MTWLLALLGAVSAVLAAVFLRRRPAALLPPAPTMDQAIEQARSARAIADARQLVEIAAARATSAADRAELLEALRGTGDEDEDIRRLIAAGERVRER